MASKELRALIVLAGKIDPSLQSAMLKASGESAKLARNTEKSARGLNNVSASVKSTLSPFAALAGSLTAFLGAQKIIDTADAWTTVRSRVGLVTDSIQQQQESLDSLYGIAQKTKQSYEVTGDLYAKIAMNAKQMKLANNDVLRITETVNKALRIGGGTTQQNQAAVLQFSQALASGRLQGDELRSLLENAPRLTKALTEGLGVATGSLKKMGSEGVLTSDVIIKALQSQVGVIDQEYTKMPVTIRQAFTYMSNAFGKFLDTTGKGTDIFNRIAAGIVKGTDMIFNNMEKVSSAMKFLSDHSNILIPVLAGVVSSIAAFKIIRTVTILMDLWKASTIATTFAQKGFNAALRENPIGLAVTAIGLLVAAGVYLYRNWDTVKLKAIQMWVDLKNSFAEGVNYAIQKINLLIDGINRVTGKHIAKIELVSYDTRFNSMGNFKAQGYAEGGIATRPSIFGEAGAEMAIPLQRTPRSLGLLNQTAQILGAGGSNGVNITIQVYAPDSSATSIVSTAREAFEDLAERYFGDKARVSYG